MFRKMEKTGERPSAVLCPRCEVACTEILFGDLAVSEVLEANGAHEL